MARSGLRGTELVGMLLVAGLVFSLLKTRLGGVRGAGASPQANRDVRELEAFQAVTLTGVGTVRVERGDAPRVVIRADKDVLPLLTTRVENGTLYLGSREGAGFSARRPIVFEVTAPDVTRLALAGAGSFEAEGLEGERLTLVLSGSGTLRVRNLEADQLSVDISGEGRIEVEGEVARQSVTLSGAGDYEACRLESELASVEISGVGNAHVYAEDELNVLLSGVGNLRYRGDPELETTVSGLGRATRSRSCD